MIQVAGKITTKNENLGEEIEVTVACSVPETYTEAVEFYGSEEEVVKALQADVKRKQCNAARPLLRDAETELPWLDVAQKAVDDYKPGRKGGFSVTVNEDEIDGIMAEGNTADLVAYLAAKGVKLG